MAINTDLQWSEGSYRGFFTLEVTPSTVTATYYAMQNVSEYPVLLMICLRRSRMHADRLHGTMCIGTPNLGGFASATFIVHAGQNKLARPVAGGKVLAGALKVQG